MCVLAVLRENWHELVRKSIDLNREFNRTWLILGIGVRYHNSLQGICFTVYCQANPLRSPEILGYLHVINTAAVSFSWENVAQYDFCFRNYMEKYPQKSWAQSNLQFWSLCMVDPIRSGAGASNSSNKNWRDICCWRCNRNACSRSAAECKFEHRCSFCGSFSHVYVNCPKRGKKGKGKGKKHTQSQGQTDHQSDQPNN